MSAQQSPAILPQDINARESRLNYTSNQLSDYHVVQTILNDYNIFTEIETFLSGKSEQVTVGPDGSRRSDYIDSGFRLISDRGLHALLWTIRSSLSQHTILGNIERQDAKEAIASLREDIIRQVMIHKHDWEIDDTNIEIIIDNIVRTCKPFIERSIAALQSKLLSQSTQISENVMQTQKPSGWNPFRRS